ncbi:hypothetical protein G9A89_009992 [Geosiphon pyriformis]|nr:hypothetical protein G9A89_009992 [Geosiphon pyriformis]
MVHTIFEESASLPPSDEKEIKRILSLEYRVAELENNLLKASTAALEKRVGELEAELKISHEECKKLRETITQMKTISSPLPAITTFNINEQKNVKTLVPEILGEVEQNEKSNKDSPKAQYNSENGDNDRAKKTSSPVQLSDNDNDEDGAYERILKIIEKMRSDCIRAINLKIPTGSRLPKNPFMKRQDSKSNLKQFPIPIPTTSGVTSPTKMPLLPRTPSCTSLPSRPGTPSSLSTVPGSTIPISGIPASGVSTTLTSTVGTPNKAMSLPIRSSTNISCISRPATPISSSPVTSYFLNQVVEEQSQNPHPLSHNSTPKTFAIPIRAGTSRPTTPTLRSSTPSSFFHSNLSTSPPPINPFGFVSEVAKNTSIPLRSRASSYSLNSSRPTTPFRSPAASLYSLFPHEKLASVQN